MTVQEQLRALIERHLVHLGEQLATVTELLTPQDETATLPVAQVIEAEGIMHQVKGTAGSMGFAEIGATARALDESLKVIMKRPEPIPAAELVPALEHLGALQRMADGATPAMSALYNVDLSKLG
jgi:HPt (histidine-containing phosphotransfer) domain-containing protein